MNYGREYFFENYKKQYGRTYLEDFDKIKGIGIKRCGQIRRLVSGGRLLDVGCGYGPFLSAAEQAGYSPFGIDISKEAAAYTGEELGFKVAAASLEEFLPGALGVQEFDVITLWFVIEHLKEPAEALRKINTMLRTGGVFAFSTPNYNGITRILSMNRFLGANPVDHYAVWTPQTARKLLKKYGFKVKYVRTPVVHQQRFFRNQDNYLKLRGPVKKLTDSVLRFINSVCLLGDTFEVYAVKQHDVKGR
jgi:2-polyprenyl-3-methyl-5-hydroxy-6-metoxy-1,4-benzoquinol methylase